MYQGKYASAEKAVKEKRRASRGTKVFYSIYAVVLVLLCLGIAFALFALNDWLSSYEASQPDTKAQQAFDRYFADPDWGQIYDLAGLRDTEYEGKDAYIAYMTAKAGTTPLTYVKTSAGLTGGQKYIVKLDGENLATFTLQNSAQSELEIPNWELDTVEVFVDRRESVAIHALPDQTVSINGVALTEDHIVMSTSTLAEDYLPEGVHGAQSVVYYVDGLLAAPTVTVTDPQGQPVQTVYDEANGIYTQSLQAQALPDGVAERMVSAVQAYCRYMINAGGNMSSYFDTSSQIYKTIIKNEMWFKGYSSYAFTPEQITAPYVYSDTLISARLSLQLNVTRSSNGTVKTFDVDNTIFMEKKSNGQWMIVDMVNVDVQAPRTQVRLTYTLDGAELSSALVDASAGTLTPPAVTIPEGKVFAGWFRETVDDAGNKTLALMFQPDENGTVTLPAGYILEPMELQALFENEEA